MKLLTQKASFVNSLLLSLFTSSFDQKIKVFLILGVAVSALTAPAAFAQVPSRSVPRATLQRTEPTFQQIPIQKANSEDEGEDVSYRQNDWPMYNHDPSGTRHNIAERQLNPDTVRNLKIKWTFPTDGNVNATPVVVGDRVYAGDTSGNFYALAKTGQLIWKTKVNGPITASALVTGRRVIFGDLAGFIYGLNIQNGSIAWTIRPNANPYAQVYGSPTLVGRQVVIGIASDEDAVSNGCTAFPCKFRGSIVRLNPNNGKVLWQTYTITSEESNNGASGASVWSTPTYDPTTKLIYVTTGDNYTQPATSTSDSFIALNARTGQIVWHRQLVAGDAGLGHPDVDFGDSPQIYRLQNGRKVVGAGGKNGTYYVLDAATGSLVNQNPLIPQSSCNPALGLFADSAVTRGVVYANGADGCTFTGALFALTGDASRILWKFTSPGSPALSGVAVANGVVYFQVVNASVGLLYALDARDGSQLAQVPINPAISGPSVGDDQVYVGVGVTYPPFIVTQGGSIVALGL